MDGSLCSAMYTHSRVLLCIFLQQQIQMKVTYYHVGLQGGTGRQFNVSIQQRCPEVRPLSSVLCRSWLSTTVYQGPLRLLFLLLVLVHQPVSTFHFIQLPFCCSAGRCGEELISRDIAYNRCVRRCLVL